MQICLQNAEGINRQIGDPASTTSSAMKRSSKKKSPVRNSNINSSITDTTDTTDTADTTDTTDAPSYNWIKTLIIVTVIGTIIMIGIFFALIARFEASRPGMRPKYTWPHEMEDHRHHHHNRRDL